MQRHKVDSLSGCSRRSSSKAGKVLCCLTQPNPYYPKFPDQTGLLDLLSRLLALLTSQFKCCEASTAPSSCHQPFLRDGIRRHSPQVEGHISASLPWQDGERPFQATLNFPNRLSFVRGWELSSALSMDCVTVKGMGTLYTQYWLYARVISSAYLPLG